MGTLIPPIGKKPRLGALYIYDTEHTSHNKKHFYDILCENLHSLLASMLHGNNKLVRTFLSLLNLVNTNRIMEDVLLVIYAHESKYNVLEASEVMALIVGDEYGAPEIILHRRAEYMLMGWRNLTPFE